MLLKPLRSRIEMLLDYFGDFFREAVSALLNRLEVLSDLLAKVVVGLSDLFPNGFLGRLKDLFRLLARLAQNLRAQIVAQAYQKFFFYLRGNMR